ncbi:MAG: HD domain-containing protein [Bacteroidota bacterium]
MTTTPATIDILIFVAFLVLNLVVGFKYRGKSQTFKEYAIGDKKFSTATLTATVVATWMSGSALFIDLENTYSRGLYYMIAILIGTIVGFLLITSRVLGPRMGKFLNNVSVPECLGTLYGKPVQTIAGIGAVLSNIGYIAIQFEVISRILKTLFNYDSPWVTVIAGTIIMLYSISGGVKAVTFTDVIQFFTFGTLLPVLALAIWNKVKDPSEVAYVLNHNPLLSFKKVVGWTPEFMGTIALIGYFIIPELPPQLFQRIAMARDVAQVKRSMTYASVVLLAITLCTMWIAVLLLVDQPGLESSQVVQYMVNEYTYPGLKGFLGVGVIALAMSTADSALNSCAVVIANDILLPLWPKQYNSLKVARWSTLVLGSLSLLMALKDLDLLDLLLLSASFYSPIAIIPMLLTIFGFQTSRRVVLMAMAAGFMTVMSCLVYFKSVNSFFPGMIANFIVLLGAHYLLGEQGGWGHNPVESDLSTLPQRSNWKEWLAATRQFKLYAYLKRVLPQQEYAYLFLGFYIFTTTYALLYLLPPTVALQYPKLYSSIQYSVTMIITSFLAFPIWPKPLQSSRFLVWIWPMSIFYALFVVGGILVIMSGFALPQMLLLALNFVMALLLLHWPLAIGMATGGIFVAICFFKQYTGLESIPGDLGSLQFKIIYGLLLLSSFLITLFKHKQAYYNLERYNALLTQERQVTNEELIKALHAEEHFFTEVGTEGNDLLEAVIQKVEKFKQQAQKMATAQQLTPTSQVLQEVNMALKDTMDYLRNVAYRAYNYLRLEVSTTPIDKLLTESLDVLKVQDIETREQLRIMNMASYQTLECDTARIQQLLVNAVLCAQHNIPNPSYPIFLHMQETFLGYPLTSVKNYIKEVAALCITVTRAKLPPVPKALYMGTMNSNDFWLPQSREALGLFDNQRIVEAHYGVTELTKGEEGLTQTYVIPVRLREVRPPMMDIPQMEIGRLGKGPQEVLPEETALLTRLQEETTVDITLAEKAIKTIKKFHGHVKRKSGEPFYLHPIAATEILLDYAQDQAAVLATLLHDAVEDTPLTLSEIGVVFGPDVANIVNKVTHLEGQFQRIKMNPQENIRQLLEETDIRVLQVKLADRLHNMRTIEGHPSLAKQKKIADETLHFFVSIAKYLGLKQIEEELQEIIAKVLKKR